MYSPYFKSMVKRSRAHQYRDFLRTTVRPIKITNMMSAANINFTITQQFVRIALDRGHIEKDDGDWGALYTITPKGSIYLRKLEILDDIPLGEKQ